MSILAMVDHAIARQQKARRKHEAERVADELEREADGAAPCDEQDPEWVRVSASQLRWWAKRLRGRP